jgi:hypothetical protein
MTKELALYESARAALAKAVKVDEVKEIRDKAMAIKAAAKIAKDREMEANAYELRARAERRLGEMMEAGKADRASQGGDRKSKDSAKLLKPTLKEVGIDGNLAHRCRSAAGMSEEAFAEHVEMHREGILHPAFQAAYPETEEQKAERLAERREDRKRRKEEMAKRRTEIDAAFGEDDDEPPHVEVVAVAATQKPKRVTLPNATEQCVVAVRVVVQNAIAEMRRGGAGEQKIRFLLQKLSDELHRLENINLPPGEQSVEERRAEMAKLAEADESSTQTA